MSGIEVVLFFFDYSFSLSPEVPPYAPPWSSTGQSPASVAGTFTARVVYVVWVLLTIRAYLWDHLTRRKQTSSPRVPSELEHKEEYRGVLYMYM